MIDFKIQYWLFCSNDKLEMNVIRGWTSNTLSLSIDITIFIYYSVECIRFLLCIAMFSSQFPLLF